MVDNQSQMPCLQSLESVKVRTFFFLKCREIKKGEESEVQRESEHDIHAI